MIKYFLLISLLTNLANAAIFPQGSCRPQQCSNSPYELVWVNTSCFQIKAKPCVGPCCDTLTSLLQKIAISVDPLCKSDFKYVTLNGIKKGGGVFYDLYSYGNITYGELIITSLQMYNGEGVNNTLCLNVNKPCDDLNILCMGLPCVYSIYDPFRHICCPICNFTDYSQLPLISPIPSAPNIPPPPPNEILPIPTNCEICTMFCVVQSSGPISSQPPNPTTDTCKLLAQFTGGTCKPYDSPSQLSCVKACTQGTQESTDVICNDSVGPSNARALFNAVGYEQYNCNMMAHVLTTCNCVKTHFSIQCPYEPNPSTPSSTPNPPPPNPPPPNPPPPNHSPPNPPPPNPPPPNPPPPNPPPPNHSPPNHSPPNPPPPNHSPPNHSPAECPPASCSYVPKCTCVCE